MSFDLDDKGDEIASGGLREHRDYVLLARMKEKGLNPENFEFYLKAFRYGMPPHGGWGFGPDRVVQKVPRLPNLWGGLLVPPDPVPLVAVPPIHRGGILFSGPPRFSLQGEGAGATK